MTYKTAKRVEPGDTVVRKIDGKPLRITSVKDLYYAYPVPAVMLTCNDGLTYRHTSLN